MKLNEIMKKVAETECKTLIAKINKHDQVELNLEQFKKEYDPYRHMTGWDVIINPVIRNDRIESGAGTKHRIYFEDPRWFVIFANSHLEYWDWDIE